MALICFYTIEGGPGASAPQPVPARSLGGFASTTVWGGGVQGDLFGIASAENVADGRPDFRAIYVYNDSDTDTLTDLRLYVDPGTTGAEGLSVGEDPRPASYIDSLSSQAVETSTIYSPPAGVTFAAPGNYTLGVPIGDLPPTAGKTFWIRRVPLGSDGAPNDWVDITIEDADGYAIVRRIYWETSPYANTTRPDQPPNADPTPSPFRRVSVDFLTAGGSRVTWSLDSSIIDDGPYVFQLQFARSGNASESDWVDVGPPVEDAAYLLDPDQRLWGADLSAANYRVILTTADNHYTSYPAPCLGVLDIRGWAEVQEIIRKEKLMLRQFVGEDGYLLRARRYGTLCECVDVDTGEINNSSCPICYGNKFVGGFYAPVPMRFANTTNASIQERVQYNEGLGTTRPRRIFGRVTGDVLAASRDAWISTGEDRRYYIHDVTSVSQLRGVDVVLRLEFRAAPRSDILHSIKIVRPEIPAPDWKQVETMEV